MKEIVKELESLETDQYVDDLIKDINELARDNKVDIDQKFPPLIVACRRSNWQQMRLYVPPKKKY